MQIDLLSRCMQQDNIIMGAVFRPKDLIRGNRRVIDNAIKDFAPDTKDNVNKLLGSWEGKKSEERLKKIVGEDKAEELLNNIFKSKRKINNAKDIKFYDG